MTIETLYQQMLAAMGPRHWLQAGIPPAETPWEILWGVFSFRIPTGATWITHWLI
nr:hypothetical protein [Lactiplantibacillus plantarum]